MATLVMRDLWDAFASEHAARPWAPGNVDCCLFLADWAMRLGHPDPSAHLRGTYSDDTGFHAIIAAAGGVVPLVGYCASLIDAKRIQRPLCGAIGVIGSQSNIYRQFGAIHDGEGWNVRFTNGVHRMVAAPLAIWNIDHVGAQVKLNS